MDENSVSDCDPAMLATTVFNNILEGIQKSNLNYQLQLTPFSALVSLKKSFVKDKSGKFLFPNKNVINGEYLQYENCQLMNQIDSLNQKLQEMHTRSKNDAETIRILGLKAANAEVSALKLYKDKDEDMNVLEKAIKSADSEIYSLRNEIKGKNKTIKETAKEFHNLNLNCERFKANFENSKKEINALRCENKKLHIKLKNKPDNDATHVTEKSRSKDANENIPDFTSIVHQNPTDYTVKCLSIGEVPETPISPQITPESSVELLVTTAPYQCTSSAISTYSTTESSSPGLHAFPTTPQCESRPLQPRTTPGSPPTSINYNDPQIQLMKDKITEIKNENPNKSHFECVKEMIRQVKLPYELNNEPFEANENDPYSDFTHKV